MINKHFKYFCFIISMQKVNAFGHTPWSSYLAKSSPVNAVRQYDVFSKLGFVFSIVLILAGYLWRKIGI